MSNLLPLMPRKDAYVSNSVRMIIDPWKYDEVNLIGKDTRYMHQLTSCHETPRKCAKQRTIDVTRRKRSSISFPSFPVDIHFGTRDIFLAREDHAWITVM